MKIAFGAPPGAATILAVTKAVSFAQDVLSTGIAFVIITKSPTLKSTALAK